MSRTQVWSLTQRYWYWILNILPLSRRFVVRSFFSPQYFFPLLASFVLRSTFLPRSFIPWIGATKILLLAVDKSRVKRIKAMNEMKEPNSSSSRVPFAFSRLKLRFFFFHSLTFFRSSFRHPTTFISLHPPSLPHSNSSHYTSNCILPFTLSHHFSRDLKKKSKEERYTLCFKSLFIHPVTETVTS